jgi:hypothetical protein
MRTELMYEVVLVGVTSMVIGCGSGPIIGDEIGDDEIGDASETDGTDGTDTDVDESETDESETDESETDTAETDTAETDTETDTDESETGDGDGDVCVTAEGTLGPAALRLDPIQDRAWVIDGGDELELALSGPASEEPWLMGAAAADRIAVARIVGSFGQQQARIHAFDRSSGELVWVREIEDVGTSQLWAGEDGWITGSTNPSESGQTTGFAMNDDEAFALNGYRPIAAAAKGWLAAQELEMDGTATAIGWIALDDASWTPAAPLPTDVHTARVADDDHTLEYIADNGLGPVFVRATPAGSEVFDLPNDQLTSDSIGLAATAGRFRLLHVFEPADQSAVFVRVDIETSEAIVVDPQPPTDWTWFDCYWRAARITPEGAVLFELNDAAGARVWAYEPEGEQWSPVGLALGMVDDIDFVGGVGAVHAVHASAQFMTFCPQLEWTEPPVDALLGESLQLVRHAPALAIELPTIGSWWQVQVDEHERCVAYPNEEGWRVRALEGEAELAFGPASGSWLWID